MNLYKAMLFKLIFCLAIAPAFGASYYGGTATKPHGHTGVGDGGKITNFDILGRARQLTNKNVPAITIGSAVPTSTPTVIGDVFIDTVAHKSYIATGSTGTWDWTLNGIGQASAWTATNPAGLTSWYDASDGPTPSTSGSTVTGWNDKATTANHMSILQGTPKISTYTQNGLSMVYLDGSSCMYGSNKTDGGQPNTMYMAILPTGLTTPLSAYIFDMYDTSMMIFKPAASMAIAGYAGTSLPGATIANNIPILVTVVFNGNSSTVQVNDGVVTSGAAGANTNTNFPTLGCHQGDYLYKYTGYYMDIRIYSGAASAGDQELTKADMYKRWGIPH